MSVEQIVSDLLWHYQNFGERQRVPFYSYDRKAERKYVRKMRKSLKRVIKYYGGKVK